MALLHYLQLYNASVASGAVRTLYTVPAGFRVVVRNVVVANRAASASAPTMSVNAARVIQWYALTAAGTTGATNSQDFRFILNPGDFLSFNVPAPGPCDVLATGSIYSI